MTNRSHRKQLLKGSIEMFKPRLWMRYSHRIGIRRCAYLVREIAYETRPNTRMRLKQILSIQWADVDWDNGVLSVFEPKSQVRSSIPINNSIRSILERRRLLSPGPFGDFRSPVLLEKAVHRITMAFGN